MQSKSDLFKIISIKEKRVGLYEHKLAGVSFWRLVRLPVLRKYLLNEYDIGKADIRTKKRKLEMSKLIDILSTIYRSFAHLCSILFFNKKDIDSVVLAFPRLQKVGCEHVDKFTDPLIDYSNLKDSYVIFQRHHGGKHYENRRHSEQTLTTDSIIFISKFLALVFFPVVFVMYFFPMLNLFFVARKEFSITYKAFISFFVKLSEFIITSKLYRYVFKRLKVKQVFLVNREIFFAETFACKQLGIETYELQHGVTHSWTLLYSGLFDDKLDTDHFLSFGSNWKGKQFGVPVENIINIGWAYKDFIKEKTSAVEELDAILIISEEINSITPVIEQLSINFPDETFNVRPHPNDFISKELLIKFEAMPNVVIVDNRIESLVALQSYKYVMGVSSTALFEALSLNIKVGVLNFGGCNSLLSPNLYSEVMYFMNNLNDFKVFISSGHSTDTDSHSFYGDFDACMVNILLAKN